MSGTRRRFFQDAAMFGAGMLGLSKTVRAGSPQDKLQSPRANENASHHSYGSHGPHPSPANAATTRGHAQPMATPDLADLPYEMVGAVKVFQLVAEPVK